MTYLGSVQVDTAIDPRYADHTVADWAMEFIHRYSGIDGDHHQKWLVDQVARILKGTPVIINRASWDDHASEDRPQTGEPSQAYLDWVEVMRGGVDSEGDREYDYDVGTAP